MDSISYLHKNISHFSTHHSPPPDITLSKPLHSTNTNHTNPLYKSHTPLSYPQQNLTSFTMASVTSSAVSIPSFTGLKAIGATTTTASRPTAIRVAAAAPKLSVKASLKEAVATAAVAISASALLAGNALAVEVLLGANDGGLVFEPSTFTVASGEKIVFKNNRGFPHNVVFDEDEIPAGVDASKISMSEEDLLNANGEEYAVTLTEKGTYSFYCSPHQGAGMVGKVTVN